MESVTASAVSVSVGMENFTVSREYSSKPNVGSILSESENQGGTRSGGLSDRLDVNDVAGPKREDGAQRRKECGKRLRP